MASAGWYGVRCVFRWPHEDEGLYEENVTVWRAASFDEAIAEAEAEARDYANATDGAYLDFAQAYFIGAEPLAEGSEVFSLMRTSALPAEEYVTRHFDTGHERQGQVDPDRAGRRIRGRSGGGADAKRP
ncbi:hypothetical protein BJF79_16295 [Actinomadura sp. CNU-125]|uniref:hypothetical protein n=1 Tax=Actinomadura sp. CNU-125 TaxID=1904961 RepID=UPI000964EAF7|nr:hypothetical protein [Actinomadura sp. CNU-125]OLT20297.1 hypothetical protein BJF79_16295 [Actinomadura sp. CNU-125]